MKPPTRNRLTESGVTVVIALTTGMPCCGDLLAGGQEFGAERRHDALGHRARHDVAVHRAVLGGEVEQPQDAGPRIAFDVGGGRGERDG